MAGEPLITVVGNLVADPEQRVSQSGKAWVTFRIASTPRVRDRQSGDWSDGEALWLSCRAYSEYADNIAASLTKGTRVIVQGRLTQRSYKDNQGQQRTSLELEVEEIGPSLRFAAAQVTRGGTGGAPAGSGWAKPPAAPPAQYGSTPGGGWANPNGGQPAAPPPTENPWANQPATGGFDDEQPF
ncbi:single-stranded DNA-binding protein [Pseudomonas sp.]|uniref:single-stranded DNA-binding protein n=1 Tax=Pseudomonas sp. TaxID=306 RepID=UPI00260DE0EE|nr:single-stranded DNA-binding protein [Pseudomonas sp.]